MVEFRVQWGNLQDDGSKMLGRPTGSQDITEGDAVTIMTSRNYAAHEHLYTARSQASAAQDRGRLSCNCHTKFYATTTCSATAWAPRQTTSPSETC
jgi:hypothetical protein